MDVHAFFHIATDTIELQPVDADDTDIVKAYDLYDLMAGVTVEREEWRGPYGNEAIYVTVIDWSDLEGSELDEAVEEQVREAAKRDGYTVHGFETI